MFELQHGHFWFSDHRDEIGFDLLHAVGTLPRAAHRVIRVCCYRGDYGTNKALDKKEILWDDSRNFESLMVGPITRLHSRFHGVKRYERRFNFKKRLPRYPASGPRTVNPHTRAVVMVTFATRSCLIRRLATLECLFTPPLNAQPASFHLLRSPPALTEIA